MTGEMYKPENAEIKDTSYWVDQICVWGTSLLGDASVLIYPNYPEFFDEAERLREEGWEEAEVRPYDVYCGPYIWTKDFELWKDENDEWMEL